MPAKKKTEPPKMQIALTKSLSGRFQKHIATANSLGLRRIGDTTIQPENPQTLGKLAKIGYLVSVRAAVKEGKA